MAGASKGVGLEIVRALQKRGDDVVGMARSEDAAAFLEEIGAKFVQVNALDYREIDPAMKAAGPVDTIICMIGGEPGDLQRADWPGARNFIDAAKRHGVTRFILVTGIGCGDSRAIVPAPVLERIGSALMEKDLAESYLRASNLDWTIVRPGGLVSEGGTGEGVLTESETVLGSIDRVDTASLIVRCLDSANSIGKTMAAVDRGKVRTEGQCVEFEFA